MSPMKDTDSITVIGTGLLGGSIALGLRAAGHRGPIAGIGRRRETLALAAQLQCFDKLELIAEMLPLIQASDLLVLAVPLGQFEPMMQAIAGADHDGLVLTDVGSAKREVCEAADRLLPCPARFVGSHPMAGGEQHGPEHARADLFRSAVCILTPTEQTDRRALETVEQLWASLGMRVVRMSAAEHDRKAARISHLPHAVAALLVELAAQDGLDIASTGFRDTTRVAGGDPRVWADIFASNRREVVDAMDAFASELARLREQLAAGADSETLSSFLAKAREHRDRWLAEQAAEEDGG